MKGLTMEVEMRKMPRRFEYIENTSTTCGSPSLTYLLPVNANMAHQKSKSIVITLKILTPARPSIVPFIN